MKEDITKKMTNFLEKYDSISFIGMSKNAGKTTTLNYFIEKTRGKFTLGLSSIGRDGETVDRLTSTEKPKVYVYKGTVIATCATCYLLSDATLEILDVTKFSTPLGVVVIARAITDGYVEIAGPSTNLEIRAIIESMIKFGAEKIFIDGALSRKSLASPNVAEATVLSTGASLSKDISKIIKETVLSYKLLKISKIKNEKIYLKIKNYKGLNSLMILDKSGRIKFCDNHTIMGNECEVLDNINEESRYIYTSGAITDSFIDKLLKSIGKNIQLDIIVEDGTKLFLTDENLSKLDMRKVGLFCMDKINVIAITVNPFSVMDYSIDSNLIISNLQKYIEIPIFDVKGEN